MKIGMMWFDNSGAPLETKIGRAVEYYIGKYGATPTTVYVSPKTAEPGKLAGVEVKTSRSILPGNFWVGRE